MASRQHLRRIHRLAAQFEEQVQRAVRGAINTSRREADLEAIEAELNRLAGLRRARRLRRSDFERLNELVVMRRIGRAVADRGGLRRAFRAGAEAGVKELPQSVQLAVSFDRVNQESIRFLDQSEMRLIREIDDDVRRGVEAIVRQGFIDGLPPVEQARRIREIVGLTERQARAVYNFRKQMELRADLWPGAHPKLRPAATRRLSATEQAEVRRHFREGHLGRRGVDRLVNRYRDSLTNRRALNIARTESLRASHEGGQALWRSALEQDLIREDEVQREWIATLDDRVRPEHRAANGQRVGMNEPFIIGGQRVMMPPASVNCRCAVGLVFGESG